MKWTVVWLQEAEDELTTAWLQSNNRTAISEAANQVDTLLRTNPEEHGKRHAEQFRILIYSPLAVAYSIDEPNRIVRILGLQIL